jgi:hypothetical protein
VDSCCHQFKNWWLLLFSSFAEKEENANKSGWQASSKKTQKPPIFSHQRLLISLYFLILRVILRLTRNHVKGK